LGRNQLQGLLLLLLSALLLLLPAEMAAKGGVPLLADGPCSSTKTQTAGGEIDRARAHLALDSEYVRVPDLAKHTERGTRQSAAKHSHTAASSPAAASC
jgi:hypothetical protein